MIGFCFHCLDRCSTQNLKMAICSLDSQFANHQFSGCTILIDLTALLFYILECKPSKVKVLCSVESFLISNLDTKPFGHHSSTMNYAIQMVWHSVAGSPSNHQTATPLPFVSSVQTPNEARCSFFDVEDPRRDVQLSMAEVRESQKSFLRLGIRSLELKLKIFMLPFFV